MQGFELSLACVCAFVRVDLPGPERWGYRVTHSVQYKETHTHTQQLAHKTHNHTAAASHQISHRLKYSFFLVEKNERARQFLSLFSLQRQKAFRHTKQKKRYAFIAQIALYYSCSLAPNVYVPSH